MLKTIAIAFATLALASASVAQSPAPPAAAPRVAPPPTKPQGGTYKIEPEHTRVLFAVSHLGFTTYFGEFTRPSGTLRLDPNNWPASVVDVSVPVANVLTPSERLNTELKSPEWIDAAQFPNMTFRSTGVIPTGPRSADVIGDLTLHGVTKRVTFAVHFNGAGPNPLSKAYTTGFEVRGSINRSDFGVAKYVPLVGDKVDIIISAAFERQPS